jgi:hypothetical protein
MKPDALPARARRSLDELHKAGSRWLLAELWWFVRTTGKWWLVPVLVALAVLGLVVTLSASGYGPLLYSLF